MLSFVVPSCDWPVTAEPARNLSFRRSVSMPSDISSDSNSESSSPVNEMRFEDVFIAKSSVDKKMSTAEKKKMRKMKSVSPVVKPKISQSENESQSNEESEKKKKRKKKWKNMESNDVGFNMSLLPRPGKSSSMNDEEVHKILDAIDEEYLEMEEKMTPYEHLSKFEGNRLEDRYVRVDRDRKIRKAHKQVKDKYCKSVRNNDGRKKLYVHHRVMRLMDLEPARAHLHYPSSSTNKKPEIVCQSSPSSSNSRSFGNRPRAAPPQNLNHALHNDSVMPGELSTDLITLLIALQHRDISPEDYDTLLRLDESVAPKTVSENQLKSFKTDTVNESTAGEICSVCMDPYTVGQIRKFLPCDHMFHEDCIDMWLKNSSMNCPLDGLPVDS